MVMRQKHGLRLSNAVMETGKVFAKHKLTVEAALMMLGMKTQATVRSGVTARTRM